MIGTSRSSQCICRFCFVGVYALQCAHSVMFNGLSIRFASLVCKHSHFTYLTFINMFVSTFPCQNLKFRTGSGLEGKDIHINKWNATRYRSKSFIRRISEPRIHELQTFSLLSKPNCSYNRNRLREIFSITIWPMKSHKLCPFLLHCVSNAIRIKMLRTCILGIFDFHEFLSLSVPLKMEYREKIQFFFLNSRTSHVREKKKPETKIIIIDKCRFYYFPIWVFVSSDYSFGKRSRFTSGWKLEDVGQTRTQIG